MITLSENKAGENKMSFLLSPVLIVEKCNLSYQATSALDSCVRLRAIVCHVELKCVQCFPLAF